MTLRARWNRWLRKQEPIAELRGEIRQVNGLMTMLADELVRLRAKPTATTDPIPATKMTPAVDPHLGRL